MATTERTATYIPMENKIRAPHPALLAVSATTLVISAVALAVIMAKIILVPAILTVAVVMPIVGISLILVIVFATLGIVAATQRKSSLTHSASATPKLSAISPEAAVSSEAADSPSIPPILIYLQDHLGLSLNRELKENINDFTPIEVALKKILAARERFLDPSFDGNEFWTDELSTGDIYADQVIGSLYHLFNPQGNVQAFSDFVEIATVPNETLQKFKAAFLAKEEEDNPSSFDPDIAIIKGTMLRKLQGQLIAENVSRPENEFTTTCKWSMKDSYVRRHKEVIGRKKYSVRRRVMREGTFHATVHLGKNSLEIQANLDLSDFLPKRGQDNKQDPAQMTIDIFQLLVEIFNGKMDKIEAVKTTLKTDYSDQEIAAIELKLRTFGDSLIEQYVRARASLLDEKIQELLTEFPELAS